MVDGEYASRRHCEIWLDKGAWWVTDCGSTNGIRVEPATDGPATAPKLVSERGDGKPLPLDAGLRVVLSASGQGPPLNIRALRCRQPMRRRARARHPSTPIVVATRPRTAFVIEARMASGDRTVEIPA